MRRALLLLCLSPVFSSAQSRQPQQSVVLTSKRALLVLEPRMAVSQNVVRFSCSPSGRYIVAVVEVPNPRPLQIGVQPPEPLAKKLVVWDSTTGTSRDVPLSKDARLERTQVEWFTGVDKALVHTVDERFETVPASANGPAHTVFHGTTRWAILDAPSLQLREIEQRNANEYFSHSQIVASPVSAYAVKILVVGDRMEREAGPVIPGYISVRRLDANGGWGPEIKLPDVYHNLGQVGWSEDGHTLQLEIDKVPEGGGRLVPRVLRINPMDGTFADVLGPVAHYEPRARETDVRLEPETKLLEAPLANRPIVSWWLASTSMSEQPKAVLAEHASAAEMPIGEKFAAYITNGTLYTRQIIELSLDQYRQMRAAAQRAELISRAKQVALAAMMYAADYDDTLPPDLGIDKLGPYINNDKVFDGFVFVYGGGDLGKVADPANTVLGYIDGPGGRAVAYLDGHVKWEKTGG
jgi:hypothetical protein